MAPPTNGHTLLTLVARIYFPIKLQSGVSESRENGSDGLKLSDDGNFRRGVVCITPLREATEGNGQMPSRAHSSSSAGHQARSKRHLDKAGESLSCTTLIIYSGFLADFEWLLGSGERWRNSVKLSVISSASGSSQSVTRQSPTSLLPNHQKRCSRGKPGMIAGIMGAQV